MNDDWDDGWIGKQTNKESWEDGWIGKCIEFGPLAFLIFLFILQGLS